jgi:hypothetical protein
MKGFRIFMHSLRMVFGNLGHVLRLSAVLYAIFFAVFGMLGLGGSGQVNLEVGEDVSPQTVGFAVLGVILAVLFAFLGQIWIIVNWHRFVLLEDYPRGWIPHWPGVAVFAYLGRAILLALMIALIFVPVLLVVTGLLVAAPGIGVVMVSGLAALGSYLFFRLGVVLPAAAIGERLSFGEAWRATRDPDGAVVLLVFVVVAAGLVLQLPVLLLDGFGAPLLSGAFGLVAGWVNMIVGASILTTLYGHYVQGRQID